MCGGDMSPYSVIGVARNLRWRGLTSDFGAEIETPKASRGLGYEEGNPLPTAYRVWGSVASSPAAAIEFWSI